jgi:hypothetical protein
MEGWEAAARLKFERQRTQIREAVTVGQLAALVGLTVQRTRLNFVAACIRPGRPNQPSLYSRALVSQLLSKANGRQIPFPSEPLLTVEEASEFLLSNGVKLLPSTLRWSRSQTPHLAPPHIRVGLAAVRYSRAELEDFAEHRKASRISQGARTDLKEAV